MTSSYLQNTLNLEGTLGISYGKEFYQALRLWNVLCKICHNQCLPHHLNQRRNKKSLRKVVNIHGELLSVATRYFSIPILHGTSNNNLPTYIWPVRKRASYNRTRNFR